MRFILATGDQLSTAETIAREAGLLRGAHTLSVVADDFEPRRTGELAVLARAGHAQKQSLIQQLQSEDAVVAMLGDGVNDAPALKVADVGVAVGPDATDVAIQASQVFLTDGRLGSLVAGVREGRRTPANLRHAIVYLLTASFATIGVIALSLFVTDALPLTPLQILWLNLVVHLFPAIALAVKQEDMGGLDAPTRALVPGSTWAEIAGRSVVLALTGLAVVGWSVSDDQAPERTQALGVRRDGSCADRAELPDWGPRTEVPPQAPLAVDISGAVASVSRSSGRLYLPAWRCLGLSGRSGECSPLAASWPEPRRDRGRPCGRQEQVDYSTNWG